jgi:hypothetical protein
MIDSKFLIVDDAIPIEKQEKIKETLLDDSFPWFYVNDATYKSKTADSNTPILSHYYKINHTINSKFYDLIEFIGDKGADLYGFDYKDIWQVRSFLQFPLNPNWRKAFVDKLHIDLNYEHLVVLYYVMDGDGDTIIVNKEFDNNSLPYTGGVVDGMDYTNYDVLHRITPKQGRMVIFNGKYYHTAEQPTNNMRCIVNFNLI